MSRYGSARSNASRGPETATVIFPARTTLGFPITGAASRAVPRPAISARTRAEAPADTVEQSTSTRGPAPGPDMRPPAPSTADMRSSDEPTVMNTMSLAASSAALPAGLAPSRISGSALPMERLKTARSQPASRSRRPISMPMRPVPSQPSRCVSSRPAMSPGPSLGAGTDSQLQQSGHNRLHTEIGPRAAPLSMPGAQPVTKPHQNGSGDRRAAPRGGCPQLRPGCSQQSMAGCAGPACPVGPACPAGAGRSRTGGLRVRSAVDPRTMSSGAR
jgi:hypothetical protein